VLEGCELVARFLFLVVGSSEELPLDEVEVYLLVLVLPLLLDGGVPLNAVEPGCFY
jgi:hypothetical protein